MNPDEIKRRIAELEKQLASLHPLLEPSLGALMHLQIAGLQNLLDEEGGRT